MEGGDTRNQTLFWWNTRFPCFIQSTIYRIYNHTSLVSHRKGTADLEKLIYFCQLLLSAEIQIHNHDISNTETLHGPQREQMLVLYSEILTKKWRTSFKLSNQCIICITTMIVLGREYRIPTGFLIISLIAAVSRYLSIILS